MNTMRLVFASVLAVLPGAALAHAGHDTVAGFISGLAHPIGGLDHVLAMVAVGFLAAQLGGRALWAVPCSFICLMVLGATLGFSGVSVPFTEIGIALSVVVLGMLIALRIALPVLLAMGIAGFFALFHGYAHGAEWPANTQALGYCAGFMVATALLHAGGLFGGLLLAKAGENAPARAAQMGGGALMAAGLVLVHAAL